MNEVKCIMLIDSGSVLYETAIRLMNIYLMAWLS